jgi:UDP-glucuronate decarboxylase
MIKSGEYILCVDNFYTCIKDNIRHLLGSKRFDLIRHDVWLPLYMEVDRIYNLDCPASPVHYQRDLVLTVKAPVMGAVNMLGLEKGDMREFCKHLRPKCMAIH